MKPLGTGDPLRLGPYRILGVLGEGGMGKVYAGQDREGTLAAVKVLHPELAHDAHLSQRFVREAQAAQAVGSTGIAAVLGAQTEGGRPWIATEFLAGPTLDQAVTDFGPFDESGVRALAVSLARTLADIHAAGFIHRDLKPANIVLTASGPRVIDFGIARPENGLTLTTTGQIPVTPGYGAPEQVLGRRVTPSADMFSLGAVLVYTASGRSAYSGDHVAAVQYEVVHGEPHLAGIGPGLLPLITPCFSKEPTWRPSPAQIMEAFAPARGSDQVWRRGPLAERIKEHERNAKQLASTPGHAAAGRSVSRRRLITGLVTGGAVLAAGGGATAWWLGSKEDQERDPFYAPPAVPTPKAHLSDSSSDSGLSHGTPKRLWSAANAVNVAPLVLMPVRDVLVVGVLSGGIAAYDVRNGKHRWTIPDAHLKGGCLSLSDQLIATVDAKGTLHTYVASTGRPKWTCPGAEAAALLASDKDAVYMLTKDNRLRSVGRTDGKIRWTVRPPSEYRGKIRHRGVVDRGLMALAANDGGILVVATNDGHPVWGFPQKTDLALQPVASDGVLYINGKTLSARRMADGKKLWSNEFDPADLGARAWGPPSVLRDSLYVNCGDRTERLNKSDGSKVWTVLDVASLDSPVLEQGNGVWMIQGRVNSPTGQMRVNTLHSGTGDSTWTYDLPPGDFHSLAADGNRVFVVHDSSLTALSVF
ncbi:PQQ-binding-like beta-propeller repeat protein [Streptomyces sp. NPDC058067]|uniref:protein kinase domain-containing protein n=1 Tax=Streptomyces sp. NPDC058067 TaxID=3346324 RepID=UPI0036EA5D56